MNVAAVIAGLGLAGAGYVLLTKTTAAAAPAAAPVPAAPVYRSGDAGVYAPAPAPSAAPLSFMTKATVANPTLDNYVATALSMASIGHAKEGKHWADLAKSSGATPAQVAQLVAAGYA